MYCNINYKPPPPNPYIQRIFVFNEQVDIPLKDTIKGRGSVYEKFKISFRKWQEYFTTCSFNFLYVEYILNSLSVSIDEYAECDSLSNMQFRGESRGVGCAVLHFFSQRANDFFYYFFISVLSSPLAPMEKSYIRPWCCYILYPRQIYNRYICTIRVSQKNIWNYTFTGYRVSNKNILNAYTFLV